MNTDLKHGVYVGRFNPVHLGHVKVIKAMLERFGPDRSLLVIGSSNTPQSLRHFFTYDERKGLIRKIFPDLKMVGLPDYHDDKVWLSALEDILNVAGFPLSETVFFGGSQEDVRFFEDEKYNTHLMNRFEGDHARISATEVRDALLMSRELEALVHPAVKDDLAKMFKEKWENFKKR